jgi:hypothetical protein
MAYGGILIPVAQTSPNPIVEVRPLFDAAWKFVIPHNTFTNPLCCTDIDSGFLEFLCHAVLHLCEISSSFRLIEFNNKGNYLQPYLLSMSFWIA